ncbi:bacillithiol biosynthesis BshC, partial [Staphylococcus pasteuri]
QQTHLTALSEGAKVVIGGQQAGLFGGPLYTFHKILSIVNLSRELTETYQQTVVPVFWIAGEDHDFEEVNHTYAYNAK